MKTSTKKRGRVSSSSDEPAVEKVKLTAFEKIEAKRKNAKQRRLFLNAKNAEMLLVAIEEQKATLPLIKASRNELEKRIAEKSLHGELSEVKQRLKATNFYIQSLEKTRNRHLPKKTDTPDEELQLWWFVVIY